MNDCIKFIVIKVIEILYMLYIIDNYFKRLFVYMYINLYALCLEFVLILEKDSFFIY